MTINGKVEVALSPRAAVFLEAMVRDLNTKKTLPEDDLAALETSAWLEEIEYAAKTAIEAGKNTAEWARAWGAT